MQEYRKKQMKTLSKSALYLFLTTSAALFVMKGCANQPEYIKPLQTEDQAIAAPLPLPTQGCDPNGCGYIDFEKHPELAGGGIVYEPVN